MSTRSATYALPALMAAAVLGFIHSGSQAADAQEAEPRYLELMHYDVASAERQAFLLKYLRETAVPALNRAGVEPVGLFTVAPAELVEGDENESAEPNYSVYVLTQFDSLEEFMSLASKIGADDEFMSSAQEYFRAPKDNPAYIRKHTKLMRAFAGFPAVEKPEDGPRYFELRTYEAYNELKAGLKVAMFNEGEIDVFKSVGMRPVFFGQTIIGQNMPHLTYMLAYRDQDEQREVWQRFRESPDWHALRDNPRYADTVSRIHRVFLVPADGSQL